MEKLINYKEDIISRGSILRFKAVYPYEDYVDIMLIENTDKASNHSLIISSGHKAGLILLRLPLESEANDFIGVKKDWLIKNWEYWIYPECHINNVYIMRNYPTPKNPNE